MKQKHSYTAHAINMIALTVGVLAPSVHRAPSPQLGLHFLISRSIKGITRGIPIEQFLTRELQRSSTRTVAAKEQANATYMTILFPDQIHRKTHRSRKQHITSIGSENAKKNESYG